MRTASPIAVPSPGLSSLSAVATRSRSRVGGTATKARLPNATSATLYAFGTLARNAYAALRAASSRVGATSVAVIEREMSTASTTVADFRGTVRSAWGRAIPTTRAASASRSRASGT